MPCTSAQAGGIDDVGLGVLLGLHTDYALKRSACWNMRAALNGIAVSARTPLVCLGWSRR